MVSKRDFPALFLNHVGRPLMQSVPLSGYSNFSTGGEADYFFEALTLEELVKAFRAARQCSIRYYVIGAGCNLLFDDEGFRGLIIRNAARGLSLRSGEGEVEALSGTPLDELVRFCQESGLAGLEFLAGIPGTVGGAVFSNAGAFGRSMGEFLKEAVLLDEKGQELSVGRDYFGFGYRYSSLKQEHHLLLKAVFILRRGKRKEIRKRIEENLRKREKKHPPPHTKYAGSYFKNPVLPGGKKVPAASLLDEVGAKDLRVGGAGVCSLHSNFIINQQNASSRDILDLAQEIKRRVKEKFGITLEEEVIFLPADSSMP